MKTIKSIFGIFALSTFMCATAFAQDTKNNEDVEVKKEVETEQGEAEYTYEKDADEGEVDTKADYYSETDTENRESETDLEHESETKDGKSSGLTQEDLDKKAEKATSGQDDMGTEQQSETYIGSAETQQDNRTEIEPNTLPNAVADSITDSEYAAWTISRVYKISPEGDQSSQSQYGSEEGMPNDQTTSEDYSYSQEGVDNSDNSMSGNSMSEENQPDVVVYEVYFLNPDGNQVESQRFDEEGSVR